MARAPTDPSAPGGAGRRGPVVIAVDARSHLHLTFHTVGPGGEPCWVIADPQGCVTVWEPVRWVPLPELLDPDSFILARYSAADGG
jgi:hypothetical protein